MGILGMNGRNGLLPTILFFLLAFSFIINGVLSRTEQENPNKLIVPDMPDESHKVKTNESQRYKLVSFNFSHVEVPYVICLWILLASIAKIGFHLYDRLPHIFPESCLLISLGILVGVTLYYTETADVTQYSLDANSFFLFLLPPIIYDAGYHMPNRAFFNNLGTILLLAVVNTLWNTMGIGLGLYAMSYLGWIHRPMSILHTFVFSALISAVDPVAVLAIFEEIQVNEILYILVFGESLLNDGVTVVIYHMMEGFVEIGEANLQIVDFLTGVASFFIVVVGGTLIGIVYGLVGAFITKYTDHVRVIEPIFIFILGYLAYLTAESMELSGILALTFGGIVMRHYTEANMAKKSTTTVKYFMKMMANVSETIIFMFLGLSTVIDSHEWHLDFILFTLLFCLIFRVTGVIFLSFMVNRRRVIRLSAIDQFIMSYGGLRGGIAFCLALLLNPHHIPERAMFVTTTMVIVFFTVFIQGITIKPVVNALKVERAEEKDPSMNEIFHRRVLNHLMAGVEDIVGKSGHNSIQHKFEYYNNKYIQPWLLREKPQTRNSSIIRVFTKLNIQEAKATAKATYGGLSRDPSFNQSIPRTPSNLSNYSRRATISVLSDRDLETVVNMHASDPAINQKLGDSPSLRQALEGSMLHPRANWSQERRHTLAEVHDAPGHQIGSLPDKMDKIGNGNGRTYSPYNTHGKKVRKNVSFSAVHSRLSKKLSDVLEYSPQAQETSAHPEEFARSEVVFTLGMPAPAPPSSSQAPAVPTNVTTESFVMSSHSYENSSSPNTSNSAPTTHPSEPTTFSGAPSRSQPLQQQQPNNESATSISQSPPTFSSISANEASDSKDSNATCTGASSGVEPATISVYSAILESAPNIPLPYASPLSMSSNIPMALTSDIGPGSKNPFGDDILDKIGAIRGDDSGQGSSSPVCDDHDLTADIELPAKEETIAESSLPWRRETSLPPVPSSMSLSLPDDENPLMSEVPSWAANLDYHQLTETGSPYHSPHNTVLADNPATSPRPVFDIFPPSSPSPDELVAIPPPWNIKDEDSGHVEEEPLPSHSIAAREAGDKANCLLISSHDLAPPSHHSCIQLPSHSMDSGNLRRVNSEASSPIHFQLMEKLDAFAVNTLESELIGIESDYHHGMRDRVSQWLASSPPNHSCINDPYHDGPSQEGSMILESLRLKKEEWSQKASESGTDADVESDCDNIDTKL